MKEINIPSQRGLISIENMPAELRGEHAQSMIGDLGLQTAEDGRIWLCVNGMAFVRFKPIASSAKG